MLAFKVAVLVVISASCIVAAPADSSEKIDCYILNLKTKNLFSEAYNPTAASTPGNCKEIVHDFDAAVEKTYNDLFARNKETADELDCIMDAFLKTNADDHIMLNVVYESKRLAGDLDKELFCKLATESKKNTKTLIEQSVEKCISNSKFVKTFSFHTDCVDPQGVIEIKHL